MVVLGAELSLVNRTSVHSKLMRRMHKHPEALL